MITVPAAEGEADAIVATPPRVTDRGVLLYMDALGLRPQIEAMCERIAGWGFAVLAPNVFYRDASAAGIAPTADLRDVDARRAHIDRVLPLLRSHAPERAAADAPHFVAALRRTAMSSSAGVATVGYCKGGALALRAAAQLPSDVNAVGSFHAGGLVTEASDSVHRLLASIRAQVLVVHADDDPSMPPEDITVFDAALRATDSDAAAMVYAGAPHGFAMADTATYHEAAARRHYGALRDLLHRALT